LEFSPKNFFSGVKFCPKKIFAQKILVKNLKSQIFMAAKIFIDSIFRGKILCSLKITLKILTAKKFFY
jgi:hypothetical protein